MQIVKSLKHAVGVFLLLGSNLAMAVPIVDVVTVSNWFDEYGESKSWTHDISDDISVGTDVVNSAALAFDFYDDESDRGRILCFGCEYATIVVNVVDFEDGGFFEIDEGFLNIDVGISGIVALNALGMLEVSITRWAGDFGLRDVTLTADVTKVSETIGVTMVPEPGTLGLLGLGLIGLGFARRVQKP